MGIGNEGVNCVPEVRWSTAEYKPCTLFLSLAPRLTTFAWGRPRSLLIFRARPITPAERHSPKSKPRNAGVRMSMNETVYLFALSVPDLLEALVADQDASSQDTRTQASQERPS